ncbi:MAG: helix-turn-helix domain-containing protein [Ruminococcaceae bacterium]|nr:helix-turn-helix domain-containing protein [Oscillospiraceae bacterium]
MLYEYGSVPFETFDIGVCYIRAWQQWEWMCRYTPSHYHECIELIHMLDGEIVIDVGEKFRLTAGDTIFIPSYVVHEIPQVDKYHFIVLQVSLALIPECEKLMGGVNPGVMVLRGDETGDLGRMFLTIRLIDRQKGIFKDLYASEEEHNTQCCLCAESLVSTVLLECRRRGLLRESENPPPRVNSMVISAVDYINAHYREKLRLSDIADALYCSPQTLSANFRSAMHMSISQYISSLRTVKVYRLISEQPEMPLSEIAELSGFQSMRSMLRAFRAQYGCTPSDIRSRKI